jgi:diguanylate cyclase (GGDEF)-like protein
MIALARREQNKMAVLFLDLDNFKRVNDTLGHHVGDQLLKEMAARLSSILRAADFVYQEEYQGTSEVLARLGGDEFIILLPKVNDSHAAAKVASRILEIMKEPFRFDGHELYNGASIGITLFPNDGTEVNDLIKRADIAMYHAKEQGRNNFQFYSDSYNLATSEQLSLESRLRRALDNDEFELYYQPQVQAETGKIVGLEALLRWNDPEHGIITPDNFIPIAEDSGLILPIGEWVLYQACRQSRAWKDAGLPPVFVSVNVSGIQLQRQELASIVDQVLSETGLEPDLLELEVTETTLMKVKQKVIDDLEAMKQKGLTISLDDFGTGYSSLNRLRELPIGKLKIDRSFVQGMISDPQDAAIVSAILFIARSLGLKTTAEGVETPEQAVRLAGDNCDYLQGYLLSRPVPAADVAELLKKEFRSVIHRERAANELAAVCD